MKTKILALLLILFVIGLQNGLGQNLLKNGDFEKSPSDGSKVANGWLAQWTPETAGAITTTTAARKGICGLWMYTKIGKSQAWIYQSVDCLPNKNYKASAFLCCPKSEGGTWTTGTEAYIMIDYLTKEGLKIKDQPQYSGKMLSLNPEWREFSIQGRSPENAAKIIFTIKITSVNGESILAADDCSILQIN